MATSCEFESHLGHHLLVELVDFRCRALAWPARVDVFRESQTQRHPIRRSMAVALFRDRGLSAKMPKIEHELCRVR